MKRVTTQFTQAQILHIRRRYDAKDSFGRKAETSMDIVRDLKAAGIITTPETIRRIGERITFAWLPEVGTPEELAEVMKSPVSAELAKDIRASEERMRKIMQEGLLNELEAKAPETKAENGPPLDGLGKPLSEEEQERLRGYRGE